MLQISFNASRRNRVTEKFTPERSAEDQLATLHKSAALPSIFSPLAFGSRLDPEKLRALRWRELRYVHRYISKHGIPLARLFEGLLPFTTVKRSFFVASLTARMKKHSIEIEKHLENLYTAFEMVSMPTVTVKPVANVLPQYVCIVQNEKDSVDPRDVASCMKLVGLLPVHR